MSRMLAGNERDAWCLEASKDPEEQQGSTRDEEARVMSVEKYVKISLLSV